MVKTLRYIHVVLGGFLLPVALVFFITGILLALDIKGGNESINWTYKEADAYRMALDDLTTSVVSSGEKRNISLDISGIPRIKEVKDVKYISWESKSAKIRVILKKADSDVINISTRKLSFLKSFVDLHLVKNGVFYTVYVIIVSIALILLSISGFLLILKNHQHRRLGVFSFFVGTIVFLMFIVL